MASVAFTVPGAPVAKARPRFGAGRTYTPKKTASYETFVAWHANDAMKHRAAFTGAVSVAARVFMKIPKSTRKRDLPDMLEGILRPVKKPDLDNILKSITDGMNTIVYADDSQIVTLTGEKFYSNEPRVEIEVMEAV